MAKIKVEGTIVELDGDEKIGRASCRERVFEGV